MPEPLIDAERVEEIVKDCLFDLLDTESLPDNYVRADGIINDYGFDPTKLEKHKAEVTEMLQGLPLPFRPQSVGGGGGWTFLP